MSRGDFLMFVGAIFWACHILDGSILSAGGSMRCNYRPSSFWPVAAKSVWAFWQEIPSLASVLAGWESVLLPAFIGVGIAYTPVLAQKNTPNRRMPPSL